MKMFPTWFVILFNIYLYIGVPVFLIYATKDTIKKTKYALENPVEYEDDFEEN
jgi:hypothetical protein